MLDIEVPGRTLDCGKGGETAREHDDGGEADDEPVAVWRIVEEMQLDRIGSEVLGEMRAQHLLRVAVLVQPFGIELRDHDCRGQFEGIGELEPELTAQGDTSLLIDRERHRRDLIGGRLNLTGTVARTDGSFLLTRSLTGRPADAERLGQTLGTSLRADSPMDIFD